jgi:multisubunit Na+/H+ antiporter MnhC subunit
MSTTMEPAQDLRSGINAITFFAFTGFCIRLWFSIDPQPEPMTLAVQQANDERMSAYFVAAGVLLFGLFALLRYIVGAILNGFAARAGRLTVGLCTGTAVLLAAAVLTSWTAPVLAVAVLTAMGANWAVEAARLKRAAG